MLYAMIEDSVLFFGCRCSARALYLFPAKSANPHTATVTEESSFWFFWRVMLENGALLALAHCKTFYG
jgi:hypothetical protein